VNKYFIAIVIYFCIVAYAKNAYELASQDNGKKFAGMMIVGRKIGFYIPPVGVVLGTADIIYQTIKKLNSFKVNVRIKVIHPVEAKSFDDIICLCGYNLNKSGCFKKDRESNGITISVFRCTACGLPSEFDTSYITKQIRAGVRV
jgi:hypothetical protein